jgi:hypothetical protein
MEPSTAVKAGTVLQEAELHDLSGMPHLPGHYLSWGAIAAGALCAAAISFVLVTFGSAIGLSAISPWPHVGLSPTVALLIAALWAALVQVIAFAAGGYVAGRVRNSWGSVASHERRFRDGMHGLIVWAVGLLVGAALVASAAVGLAKTGAQAAATVAAGAVGNPAAGSNGVALPVDSGFDYLMRPAVGQAATRDQGAATPAPAAAQPAVYRMPSAEELKPSIVRILGDALEAGSLPAADRTYLAALVSARTGMSQGDAEKRVDDAFQRAKAAETKLRAAADKARKASILAAFLAAATLAIGCAAACAGATAGGRHRDEQVELRVFGTRYFW